MYQGLIKNFLGITKEDNSLIIDPSIPASFGDYTLWYTYGSTIYEINVMVKSGDSRDIIKLIVDSVRIDGNKLKLIDDAIPHLVIAELNRK